MYNFLPIAFFENEFIPFENAKLSIATHALHYGTGAFGGMRGIPDPKNPGQVLLFRLDRHAQRLAQSAKFLQFEDLSADKIQATITEFVQKTSLISRSTFDPLFIPLISALRLGSMILKRTFLSMVWS
jgi:branched-chain amino acid aminotransferase